MSAAVKITCMDHLPAELRLAAAKSDDATKARRLLAIAMVLEGICKRYGGDGAGFELTIGADADLAAKRPGW